MIAAVNDFLTSRFGTLGPLMAVAALGLVLVAIALPSMMRKQRDRFAELAQHKDADTRRETDKKLRRSSTAGDRLEKYAHLLEPQKEEEFSATRQKLMRAGYRDKGAVRVLNAAKMVLGVGGMVVGVIYALTSSAGDAEVSTQTLLIYALIPAVAGYYLPGYWVDKRVEKRRNEIIEGFPDALDMMLVCVEAGQSLDQAILRVAKESRAGYAALGEEFDIVANEVKAGKERVQVLKDMADRVGVPDVASFVTTLVQSALFGTSIAEALRVYSADMRDKRVMRAEEKANMLPTKLTLGTMLFTVPPLLIILIGPSVHGIVVMMGQMAR